MLYLRFCQAAPVPHILHGKVIFLMKLRFPHKKPAKNQKSRQNDALPVPVCRKISKTNYGDLWECLLIRRIPRKSRGLRVGYIELRGESNEIEQLNEFTRRIAERYFHFALRRAEQTSGPYTATLRMALIIDASHAALQITSFHGAPETSPPPRTIAVHFSIPAWQIVRPSKKLLLASSENF